MTSSPLSSAALGAVAALAAGPSALAQDFIVPSGETVVVDTTVTNQLQVSRLVIERDGVLRIVGRRAFSVDAAEIVIDGTLDASGSDSIGVATLNTTNQPEFGAPGRAGGGSGGVGSAVRTQSTPFGTNGFGSFNTGNGAMLGGGLGGETSFHPSSKESRRAAGGGGGALAANQPVVTDPLAPENLGLVATGGFDGGLGGTGAVSGTGPAAGGGAGTPIFFDADPNNDFWGERIVGGSLVVGEAGRALAGRGGGAGGDASRTATFPIVPFNPFGDEKGSGGGSGGGLVLLHARRIAIGPAGHLIADGGNGGGGENVIFFDRVGGGSGGGSGGWIVMEALQIDLSGASDDAISALGGRGGVGRNDMHDVVGAGGNGGPGVIQLHTPSGSDAEVLLPPGKAVEDLSTPDGLVLLPILGG
ncbi:MAG: hypothetical protein AAGI22_07955 [Planctomycetota bacterium]